MRSAALALLLASPSAAQQTLLIEAESFTDRGGWQLDTQFIHSMGSPYLLAHGLGRPVADARTTVAIPAAGRWRVFVRTLDWVARWQAPGAPGRFAVSVGGARLETQFGTRSAAWHWHEASTPVELPAGEVELVLHDLTGFDGRCDAIVLTRDGGFQPPNDCSVLPAWRRALLGLPERAESLGPYDLVVVGGGFAGMAAAIAAARMGCEVALIQDRGVLGGNGSSEVRVWANGEIRRGRFPRIGEIVEEFRDHATASPGRAEEYADDLKERTVRAEPNLELFLHHHAFAVVRRGAAIAAVEALDVRTSARRRFTGRLFADCTGHGTIGFLAGADWDMTAEGRMGMSNMWRWTAGEQPTEFPGTPWALPLEMGDFPYPRDGKGEWFWESGFDRDPISEAEAIRDWNLRAVFGAFAAMKNGGGRDRHENAALTWVAFIGGPRESRRLLGDVVLTQEDIVQKRDFDDGCVPSTWTIDLHYPKDQYAAKFPDNPFISVAQHDRRVDRSYGYPVPYRCFYSRNVPNLFMAGRCISVTHEALGTVRVMNTCGMMGEVVGKAASICVAEHCTPRDVYRHHWPELAALLELPGTARRATVGAPIRVPDPLPPARGEMAGRDPAGMEGLVIDDPSAELAGSWHASQGVRGFVGFDYRYAAPDSGARARFPIAVQRNGRYQVRLYYGAHRNRAPRARVTVTSADDRRELRVDMREPPGEQGWISLGVFTFRIDRVGAVLLDTEDAGGIVHADAVQVIPDPR